MLNQEGGLVTNTNERSENGNGLGVAGVPSQV